MILSIILSITLAIVFKFVYKLVIKPYFGVLYYKKQGLEMRYFPGSSGILAFEKDAQEKNDYFDYGGKLVRKNPKILGYGFNTIDSPHIYLTELEAIKQFMLNIRDYKKAEMFYLFHKFMEKGVVFLNGNEWKNHRKTLSSVFHFDFLNEMVPWTVKITNNMLDKWEKNNATNMQKIDPLHLFTDITGEIVGQLFFGDKFSDYSVKGLSFPQMAAKLTVLAFQTGRKPAQLLLGPKFVNSILLEEHKVYNECVSDFFELSEKILNAKLDEIKKKKANNTYNQDKKLTKALIELLYDLREKNKEESNFTDQEIMHEFITFFIAGTDTTSHLIHMASYFYVLHPEFQEPLNKEIDEFFKNPEQLTGADLNKMEFMTAFLKETLRMFGPASGHFEKVALKDNKIGSIKVKKGTLVNVQFPVLHQNPLYHDDPMKFDPYRWLDPNSKTTESVKNNPYCFIPFYAGPRNCIGQNMAMMDSKIIVALFFKRFRAQFSDPNYNLKRTIKFTVEPVDPFYFDIQKK